MTWTTEETLLGRIAVPPDLPEGVAVFCTSADFEGRLSISSVGRLSQLLRERFRFEGGLASCGQIHGSTVATADRNANEWNETPACDALVSTEDAVALAIKIADCLPVAILDTRSSRVANVHSGWRGAAARVVPAALEKMAALHGTTPSSIRVWMGPSIRVCCFEVGSEVVEALADAYGEVESFVDRSRGPRPHVDLAGLTTHILERFGVPADAIDDSGLCTRCEASIFHSYRRDREAAGRNLMLIGSC